MAKDIIDELSLKIDIDVDKGASKAITSIARAITKLNEAVKSSANLSKLRKYVSSINRLQPNKISVRSATGVGKAMGKTIAPQYQEYNDATQTTQQIAKIEGVANNAAKAMDNLGDETRQTNKEFSKGEKPTKKYEGTFKKLIRSIGRIAFYRTIRFAIKQLTDAFREGFKNIVQYDKETNQAMSNIMNSANQLKNTLGVGLASVLKSLEPTIVAITDGMVDFVNAINLALAKMRGDDTFLKAIKQNKDYAKSMEDAKNSLLSFDKFESLTDSKDKSPFEEVSVNDEQSEVANNLLSVFSAIKEVIQIIKNLWVSLRVQESLERILPLVQRIVTWVGDLLKILSPLLDVVARILTAVFDAIEPIIQPLMEIISVIVKLLEPALTSILEIVVSLIEMIGGFLEVFSGVFKIISGLLKLLVGDFKGAWESIANGFASMVNGIANIFVGVVNFLLDILNLLLEPIDQVVNWFGGDIPELQWNAKAKWQPYANGGTFNKGTAFIAGEAGAEAVYNTSGGNGGVVNIEQFTAAMYNALSMYGAARGSDIKFGGDVYIDRTKAGQLLESSVFNEGVRVGHFAKR